MAVCARCQPIVAAFLRVAVLLPLLAAFAVVLVPPSWSPQQASVLASQATPPSWPGEGSRVGYEIFASFTAPDGSYHQETTASLTLAYDGASWSGSCIGETTEVVDGLATTSRWSLPSGGGPALAPTDAEQGETVLVALLDDAAVAEGCRQRAETVTVVGRDDGAITAAELPDTSPYQDIALSWDRETGLVLEWSRVLHGGATSGRLVESDAFDR
jgi:hypothetical protein